MSMASALLALSVPCASVFGQATALSPSLPEGHRMISACDNKGNPSKHGSLSAVPGSGDRTQYALALRDLAANRESITLVTATKKAAEQRVQDYCDGVYTPPVKVQTPYFTNTISR